MDEYNDKYYELDEFKEANELFDSFLSRCKIIKQKKEKQDDFSISTMTIVTNMCDNINVKMVFQRLKIDKDIQYIESGGKEVRGEKDIKKSSYKKKEKKKKIKDKRKLGKGSPFSNQISIGFKCDIHGHIHNNPICVKLFKNGRIQMTGCKDIDEVKYVYNKLYTKLNNIETIYYLNSKEIRIFPVQNIRTFEELDIKTEMINGTFSTKCKIDLNKILNKLKEVHMNDNDETEDDIYINSEKKSPLICYLKLFGIYDKKKSKNKIPSVFIYNSGAINIIAINEEIIMKSYEFISNFVDKYYDDIVETDIQFDETFFN
jgi:hypothetical protein